MVSVASFELTIPLGNKGSARRNAAIQVIMQYMEGSSTGMNDLPPGVVSGEGTRVYHQPGDSSMANKESVVVFSGHGYGSTVTLWPHLRDLIALLVQNGFECGKKDVWIVDGSTERIE